MNKCEGTGPKAFLQSVYPAFLVHNMQASETISLVIHCKTRVPFAPMLVQRERRNI